MAAESVSTLVDAFLIHRRPYSNTSLLVECFTAGEGRFPLIARGVQSRRRSPQSGLLQPFVPLQVQWRGGGQVKSLNRAEPAGTPFSLTGERLFCGLYLNELLMRMLQRDDPHDRLFQRYGRALAALDEGAEIENTLRHFELGMLSDLGYGVDLAWDHETGEAVDPGGDYYYYPGIGLSAKERTGGVPLTGRTIALLLSAGDLDPAGLREAKRLTRALLAFHLDDRPLKSRELFKTL